MKRIFFCGTVACLCCGPNLSFGQILELNDRLGRELGRDTTAVPVAFPQDAGIPNPFALTPEDSPSTIAPIQAELSETSGRSDPAAQSDAAMFSNTGEDPNSLDVGRQQHTRTVVDTIVDHATLANTPHASFVPVEWCEAVRTPNPIGEMMLRQYCVEGLWDGYELQRAHACAKMWCKIHGHGGCGDDCGCPTATGCVSCQAAPAVRQPVMNRYRQTRVNTRCDGRCATCVSGHSPAEISTEVQAVASPENSEVNAPTYDYFSELQQ